METIHFPTPSIALAIMYDRAPFEQANQDFNYMEDEYDWNLSTNNWSESLCSEKDDEEIATSYERKYFISSLKLEDFTVKWQLGEGAQGSVYLVKHTNTTFKSAMKVWDKSKPLTRLSINEIKHEASILSQFNNPFIVKLFKTFETPNHYSLMLEFWEGSNSLRILLSSI